MITSVEGRLVSGLGKAAGFTQIEWVRRQLIDLAGIDPYPGTVNLKLDDEANKARWRRWLDVPGAAIEPDDSSFCRARTYPVRIAERIPGAVVLPEVPGYPTDKLEFVSAIDVRRQLALADGARLAVELCGPLSAKAVLFDIDGTLVDSMGAYFEVARLAARPHGLDVTEQHVRRSLATGSNFWSGVVPEDRPDGEDLRRAMSAHAVREWPRVLREHGRLFDELAQTLDALKSLGIALGIASGARPEVLELLREEGILDRFDAIVLGADVVRHKPDPEVILKCLHELRVAPQVAIYVGDSQVDIQASRAAGVRAVGVLTGAADCAMLSLCAPDRLVSSHAKLPGIIEPA
jgi:HAD superfamily hydrolase (TIGR01509 family)